MVLIPLEYLKKYLFLPPLTPVEIATKLTYFGLETQLVKKKNQFYLEINPLPNRPDLFCWWGLIQEIKVILDCQVREFNLKVLNFSKKKMFSVSITTPHCSAFSLFLIKNIQVEDSPVWLKEWLEANQVPVVNSLVDSLNLVRLETGQVWRIYDYDILVKNKKIVVSEIEQKEVINLPFKKELILEPGEVVVRNGEKIISLVGISETEKIIWSRQTKNILIEGALFEPDLIKKTARRLNISLSSNQISCSGLFFSPSEALAKFIALLTEIQKSDLESEVIFTYQKSLKKPFAVKISQSFLEKKVGQSLRVQQIEKIWERLNFSYSKKGKIYQVEVPFYRPDLKMPEDLLEELLRVYDYNRVVSSLS